MRTRLDDHNRAAARAVDGMGDGWASMIIGEAPTARPDRAPPLSRRVDPDRRAGSPR